MKHNILIVVNSQKPGGVEYHRQIIPHDFLTDEFNVAFINEVESNEFTFQGEKVIMSELLDKFKLVQFARTLSTGWRMQETAEKLRKKGIVCVLDLDDYWEYPKDHLLYEEHIKDHVRGKVQLSIKLADCITTTTPFFADRIRHYNKNVYVLPNAINPEDQQFSVQKTNDSRVRFGWAGSHCHTNDIASINLSIKRLNEDQELKGKYQIKLGGYNGSPVSIFFEQIFTSNYHLVKDHPLYKSYLQENNERNNDQWEPMPYKRIWYKDVDNYAKGYNEFDVSLIPLVNNRFNSCKSQLKLIEAGFMKKAAICSKVMPYTIDGIDKKNCLMVKESANDFGWYQAMKKMIQNQSMVEDLAEGLYETVKDKYNVKTVSKERSELYKRLIEKKNA